ncbi:peptidyl-alpha-hydroxyglycine alpha-amidating lyase family protein [Schlesneria sp. T3-172]|uniref:peptidyl-alpha-hydroxyglycine alpha-amidating lyase family protein n=1 Tax=Schlesneria sphaerica TaxID=3373610 RepID=UPI0037CC2CC5
MTAPPIVVAFMFCIGIAGFAAADDQEPGKLPFTLVPQRKFLQIPKGQPVAQCSAVAVNSKGELFLFHRGPRPVLCFDAEGTFLRGWGDDVIKIAHGLRIDSDDNVWITDVGSSRVYKFDSQGNPLLILGTGVAGTGHNQFNEPTDIAFGPEGVVYISDGYGNSRVMKFNQNGEFISTWGTAGKDQGQFRLPHSIVVDKEQRVLVGDRENNRIQVFDTDGQWLATWKGFAPYGMAFDPEGRLFVADGRACQVLLLDDQGKVVRRWGREGKSTGQFQMPHMLTFDASGNLYVAEINGKRLQKFIRNTFDRNAAEK